MHLTRTTFTLEHIYEINVAAREKLLLDIRAEEFERKWPHFWYLVEPNYSCEDTLRVGDVIGDGAKYVCNIHHLRQQGGRCVYYGVGVDGEIFFDEALVHYIPDCDFYAFDPTEGSRIGSMPRRMRDLNITFYTSYGLTAHDGPLQIGNLEPLQGRSLDTIRRQLGHTKRPIDILKIDIEGSEWEVLESLMEDCDIDNPAAYQSLSILLLLVFFFSMNNNFNLLLLLLLWYFNSVG
jgi:hypothetical protein